MFKAKYAVLFILSLTCAYTYSQPQLFWSDVEIGQILSSGLDGMAPNAIVARNFPAYHVVDFDNNRLYWTDTGTKSVHAIDLDGSNREIIISGLIEPQGIDIVDGQIVLIDHKRIARYQVDGNFVADIVTGLDDPTDLVVHEDFIYWGDKSTSSIFRASIEGMSQQEIINSVFVLVDIEVNPLTDELYWTQAPGIPAESGIYKANTNGSGRQAVLEEFVSGIAIDALNNLIYYSEAVDHTIHRAPLDDPANDVALVDEFLRDPVTLTIDNAGGRIFFLNEQYRDFLYTVGLEGNGLEVLASSDVYLPTRFALDTANDHIYWINSKSIANDDESSAIMRADLDGTNTMELVGYPQVERPFGLALDLQSGRMYWSDLAKRGIYSATLSGGDIKTVVASGLLAPRGIALDNANDRIYWCDSNTGKIQRASKDGNDLTDIISSGLEAPYQVYVSSDGSEIYFTDYLSGRVGRFALGGEAFETLVMTQSPSSNRPNSVFVDMVDGKIYFTVDFDDPKLMVADLNGSNLMTIDVPDIASPHDIHVVRDVMSSSAAPGIRMDGPKAVVFPNPFRDRFKITTEEPIAMLHITDSGGRVIHSSGADGLNNLEIDLTGSPAGLYQLEFMFQQGQRQVMSLVKIGH